MKKTFEQPIVEVQIIADQIMFDLSSLTNSIFAAEGDDAIAD